MISTEDNPNAEILAEFIAESRETLEKVEPLIIELEQGCGPESETLAVIFRCFHSFKGTASFIDLRHTAALAHSAESLLDLFRRGAAIESRHVDLICRTLDTFRSILDALETEHSDIGQAIDCAKLVESLDEVVLEIRSNSPSTRRRREQRVDSPAAHDVVASRLQTEPLACAVETPRSEGAAEPFRLSNEFVLKFVAESEEHLVRLEELLVALESGNGTSAQLSEAFRAVHSFKGNCGICGFTEMEQLTHRMETLLGEFRDRKRKFDQRTTTLVLEIVDVLRSVLSTIPGGDGRVPALPKLLMRLDEVLLTKATPGLPPPRTPTVTPQEAPDKGQAKGGSDNGAKAGGSIRVDTEKLDELMNLVGELIIAETTVTKNPDLEGHDFENFQKAALNLNRLTRALQDIAMAVRMVPIATTFRKMIRLVRDVSAKQRKRVELILTGEDTEVDKTVIETIGDPLVHLIRNSIDHGIETTDERDNTNKDAIGKVWLDAKHQGGEVWITIRDDGRGLNPEKLLTKALERGVAEPNRRYTEREIFDFIFAPGFSTAAQITDISGRGVGMDVVRKNIEAVSGRVEVSSELGNGTTFVLRIPLTLAIIEGMLVRVGQAFYTIPLLAIRESVRAKPGDITRLSEGKELLKLRRHHFPIVKLGEVHKIALANTSALDGILVIVESNGRLACIMVDEVVGQRQTVIKPLPEYLRRVRGLSGCSILHNGDISLIVDVEAIVTSNNCAA